MDRSEWVLVPRDVTPEMWEAGMNCHSPDDTQGDYLDKVWPAMLAAAPPPPAEQASGEWPDGVLNREKTLGILTHHNAWRRGASTTQTDPRMLGLALEAVIAALAPQQPEKGETP